MKKCALVFVVLGLVLACQWTWAAPAWKIDKIVDPILGVPAVQPNPSWTGPPVDPHAVQGQWFQRGRFEGVEESRPYEFYDNVDHYGEPAEPYGGGWKSYLAIEGYASNVVYDGSNNIVSFDILASITNDLPGMPEHAASGSNSHGEYLNQKIPYADTMYATKLTASFAVDIQKLQAWGVGKLGQGPYTNLPPYINALDKTQSLENGWDQLA